MSDDRTRTPFISDETRVKVPLRVLGMFAAAVAAGAIAWGITTNRVAEHDKRIEALEGDSRSTREVLIRIDERTAEIKRRLDNGK